MPLGIFFPITDENQQKNLFDLTTDTKSAVKSNLLFFLQTRKGERFMRPYFGADLTQFIFEQNDNKQSDIIKDYLETEVSREFPYITINFVDTRNQKEHDVNLFVLSIDFTYTKGTFSYQDLIVMEFQTS